MTRPGNAAWLMASPMNASPRSTTNVPIDRADDPDEDRRDQPARMKPNAIGSSRSSSDVQRPPSWK